MLFNVVHLVTLSCAFGGILYLILFAVKLGPSSDRTVIILTSIVLLVSFLLVIGAIRFDDKKFILAIELLYSSTIWLVTFLFTRFRNMVNKNESRWQANFTMLVEGFSTGVVVTNKRKEVIAVNTKAKDLLGGHDLNHSLENLQTFINNENQDQPISQDNYSMEKMNQSRKTEGHNSPPLKIDKHSFTWNNEEYKMLLVQKMSRDEHPSKQQWRKGLDKVCMETISLFILTLDEKGHIQYMNQYGKTLLGISEEAVYKNWLDYIPAEVKPEASKFFNTPSQGSANLITPLRNKQDKECFIKWKGVGMRTLNNSGGIYIFAGEDVTEARNKNKGGDDQLEKVLKLNTELEAKLEQRKKDLLQLRQTLEGQIKERNDIENELLNSQRLFNSIAQNFPNGIIGVLNRELKYVLVGGSELERLGLKADSLFGRKVFELYPDFKKLYENKLRKAFSGEKITLDVELDGSVYNIIAVALPDMQSERVNEILVVISNVTHGRRLEEDLHRAIEQEKGLVELKSRFVTMASHEFRTPLGTILSSVFLLERYNDPGYEEKRTLHINRIKKTINNLTELLSDYLSLGKLDEGKIKVTPKQTNVVDEVFEIVKEMEGIKKGGQRIEYTPRGVNRVVMVDSHLLHNILVNLISNAIKYSPENLVINVVTELNNDELLIYVIDHGTGISEEDQPFIFERFYRSKNAANVDGSGLGLHIVKKYVELMNGSIDFRSDQNGTTFRVWIPVR